MNQSHPADKQVWQQHLEQARTQGLSFAEYAKANGLKVATLYYWNKVFARQKVDAQRPVKFHAVNVIPATTAPCVLQLSNLVVLQLSALPEPAWLVDLYRQLESRP